MDIFPTEIWILIFSKVIDWPFQPRSLLNVRLVCQDFLTISKESGVYVSYRSYTEKIREKFSEEYKRHFFYNRLIVRYCIVSGYNYEKLKDISKEEIIRLYAAHLFMCTYKDDAFISTDFPVHIEKGCVHYRDKKKRQGVYTLKELEKKVRAYLNDPYLPRNSSSLLDDNFKDDDKKDKLVKFGLIMGCSENHKCHRYKGCHCVFCGSEKHNWNNGYCQRCEERSDCPMCVMNPWTNECDYCDSLVCDDCYIKTESGGIKCDNCNEGYSSDDDY